MLAFDIGIEKYQPSGYKRDVAVLKIFFIREDTMLSLNRCGFFLIAITLLVGGCYSKPVRNLASDAALIKVGRSSSDDVLTYLGEPDEQEVVGNGVERWLYREDTASKLEKAPLVGKYFGSPTVGRVVITFKDNRVIECSYDAHDADESRWEDDFSWQKKSQ